MTATPEAPPATPVIPVGLGTKLGALGTSVLGLAALVSAFLGGDHSAETVGALVSASIVLIATIAGRFAQAYAIYRNKPPEPAVPPAGTTYLPATDLLTEAPPPPPPPRKPRPRRS